MKRFTRGLVAAVSLAMVSSMLLSPPAHAVTLAGIPTVKDVTFFGARNLTIGFAPPTSVGDGIVGYLYNTQSVANWQWIAGSASTTSLVLTDTSANGKVPFALKTTYYISLRACVTGATSNSNTWSTYCGTPSSTVTSVAGAPPPPVITGISSADKALSVSFTQSSDGGSAITNYEYQLDGGSWATASGTTSPITISSLNNGTTYSVKIRATNANGTSQESNPYVGVPATLPGKPDPPTAVAGDSKVVVSWTAPASNGSAITGYTVTGTGGGATRTCSTSGANPALTCPVTGLVNGTSYTFKVKATNSIGTGSDSDASSAVVAGSPGAPSITSLTPQDGAFSVAFTQPADTSNGSTISNYEYSTNGGSSWTARSPAATTSPLSITGLTNGQSYSVQVRAVNAFGSGVASNTITAAIPTDIPKAPNAPTINSITGGNGTLSVDFAIPSDNGSTISRYEYNINGSATWTSFAGTTSPQTISGLTNGTTYTVKIRAVNSIGTSAESASKTGTPVNAPTAPTSVTGNYLPGGYASNGAVALTWTAADGNGSTITSHRILISTDNSTFSDKVASTGSSSTSYTVSGLSSGTYYFKVAAINAAGVGTESAASSAIVVTTRPGAPTITSITPSSGQLSVAFSAPSISNSGGVTISNYEYSTDDGASWTLRGSSFSTATPLVITKLSTDGTTSLTNGTPYTIRIRAYNSEGAGDASAAQIATPNSAATKPGPPTAVVGTSGNAQVSLTWSAPASNGGSVITGYKVEYSTDKTNWTTWRDNSDTTASDTVTSLSNGTNYFFRVSAKNSVGTSDPSTVSDAVKPATTPGQVTGLVATKGVGSVSLAWNAPSTTGGSTITGYKIERTSGASWVSVFDNTGSTAVTEVVSGLTNGTLYSFRVSAINAVGTGTASSSASATPSFNPPGAPSGVAGTAGNNEVTVTWTAPTSTGGATITGYKVDYSTDGTTWTVSSSNTGSTTTSYLVTGLSNGTAYHFRVTAINGSTDSGTPATSDVTTTPCTVPDTPATVTATPDNASAVLSWSAPAANGAPISGYIIETSTNGSTWTVATSDTGSSATSYTQTGLTNGQAYYIRVRAKNAAGQGSPKAITGTLTPRTIPTTPQSFTATAGEGSVALSWSAPSSNGGDDITGYTIEKQVSGVWSTVANVSAATTSYTVNSLTNGTTYSFRVSATNGAGSSSTTSTSSKPRTKPGAPTLGSTGLGNASVQISWTAPASDGGDTITSYTVEKSTDGIAWSSVSDTPSSSAGTWTVTATGLSNGTGYYFRVSAVNGAGTGTGSTTGSKLTPRTVPGAPTTVAGSAANESVSLSWSAPSDNGGDPVTKYRIQYSVYDTATLSWGAWADKVADTGSSSTSNTITGLTNGVDYKFRVYATNGAGESDVSSASATVTPRPGASAPSEPRGVTVSAGVKSITITWTAPSSNGGAEITGYEVSYREGTGSWSTPVSVPADVLTYTYSDLLDGKTYSVKVTARNSQGPSNASDNSADTPNKPSRPAAPSGSVAAAGSISLSWSAPSNNGSSITGYTLKYKKSTDADVDASWTSVSVSGTTHTVSSLVKDTDYDFQVLATNAVGNSDLSASLTKKTPKEPGAPTDVTVSRGNSSGKVDVSWVAPSSDGGLDLDEYTVQYSLASGTPSWTSVTPAVSASTALTSVTGLTDGTEYVFRVIAKNGVGSSPASSQSSSVKPATKPGAPTSVAATQGDGSLSVTWNVPESNGGDDISGYQVDVSTDGSSWTTKVSSTALTSATVTGLTNGTGYYVRVFAVNGVGKGNSAGQTASKVSPKAAATAPGKAGTATGARGVGSIALSWSAPSDDGGASITGYKIEYKLSTDEAWSTFTSDTGSTDTTATVTSLSNGKTYDFRVTARNSQGLGTVGDSISATTADVPSRPSAPTGSTGAGQVTVTWSAPSANGASITGYIIRYKTAAADSWSETTAAAGTTSKTISGLVKNTNYQFEIVAENGVGPSEASAALEKTTPKEPDDPRNVAASAGVKSLTVTWEVPSSDGGVSIDGYDIYYRTGSGSWTSAGSVAAGVYSKSISSLLDGTTYEVKVEAKNGVGSSVAATHSASTPNKPSQPAAPSGNSAAAGVVSLTWVAPNSNGAAISGYRIEVSDDDGATWTESVADTGDTAVTRDISGLAAGKTYKFRVSARNAVGLSVASSVSNGVALAATGGGTGGGGTGGGGTDDDEESPRGGGNANNGGTGPGNSNGAGNSANASNKVNVTFIPGQPVVQDVDHVVGLELGGQIAIEAAAPLTIAVDIPAAAFDRSLTLIVTLENSLTQMKDGFVTVQVKVKDREGNWLTQVDKPISVNLGSNREDIRPYFSNNGIDWVEIARIPSGTTLPSDWKQGYYLDANGAYVVLTTHLTYFGLKAIQAPLAATVNTTSMPVAGKTSISATGGSSSAAITYQSKTPAVCSVSNSIVTALSVGRCTLQASRDQDNVYLPILSPDVSLEVTSASMKMLVTSKKTNRTISVSGGTFYAGAKVVLYTVSKGKAKVLKSLTLSDQGGATLRAKLAKGLQIEARLFSPQGNFLVATRRL